jgi:membrane protein YqaA with SNARE-associated domain
LILLLKNPVTKWLGRLSEYLISYGAFGLFIVALLDSTFVPLPSSADALMLVLSTAHPSWMLLYAFMATAGSALGCLILYLVSRRAGARALNRFSERKQQRVKHLIERYDHRFPSNSSSLPRVFSGSVCCGSCWRSLPDARFDFCWKAISRFVMARKQK